MNAGGWQQIGLERLADLVGFLSGRMMILFHKPYGVLCQFTPDQPGQRTLSEYGFPNSVYPVGRLDMDSEGLLLLCDEPGFNHRFLDPAHAHPRTYLVQVEGIPSKRSLQQLRIGGMVVRGYRTRPCEIRLCDREPAVQDRNPPVRFRKSIPTSWLEMRLIEGKNRQVRRMTAAIGHPTLRLIRIAIGGLCEMDLEPGCWRFITRRERGLLEAGVG